MALQAHAYALNLDPLATCVSCTSAQAGRNSSGAEGREFRLAGETVCEGQVPANGYANGSLVTVPSNPLLSMAIAEWDGSTTAGPSGSQAHTRAALLDLTLGRSIAELVVAGSTSDASHTDRESHARGESDGARLALAGGRLTVVALHSDGSSDGPGHEYLAALNGAQVMESTPTDVGRGATVPGVTSVTLLHSDGSGGRVASANDGRDQVVMAAGTTWVGGPSDDPQPLR